jgi:signal transduction histidine kinase
LGWLCCDNLISGGTLTYSLKSKITHFGTMLGQWLIRSKNERELKRLNQNLEEEVLQKTEDLQNSLDALVQTQSQLIHTERTKALSTFTAGVAHEINNPIGFIRSNLSYIGKVSSKVLDQMNKLDIPVLEKAESMLGDIDQVLDESVEGLDRVKNIISMLQPLNKLADEKPQHFDILQAVEFAVMGLDIPEDTIQVRSELPDAQQVRLPLQIFTLAIEHILENSRDAIKRVSKPSIDVCLTTSKTHLIISCTDNGYGISSANIGSIFLPFFTTKAPGEGLGLGLSLSQNLIQLANGNITAKSVEGKYTTLTIEFEKGVLDNV